MKTYIGTKIIKAEPLRKDGENGYRVMYEDGYESWSPKATFEAAYRDVDADLSFSNALFFIKSGCKFRRSGWNGPGQHIELQRPDDNSKMTLPYIYISTVQGDLVPWLASQTDILATDWELVA